MIQASICTIGDEILIGQVVDTNSAHIATALEEQGIKVKQMLSIGDDKNQIYNQLESQLKACDIVISTDAVQHDFDVSPIGFRRGEIPYTGLYAFPADAGLRERAHRAAEKFSAEVRCYEGRVCSGDQFIASKAQKSGIIETFGGLCCEMEGAAVAQVCHLNRVPWVIIRAISDKADDSGKFSFETFKRGAARRGTAIAIELAAQA